MTLARYLSRLFFPAFGFAVAILTFVAFMSQFVRIFNVALMKGISPLWIVQCFLLILPYFLGMTLPVAFLIAAMLTLGRLAETGETLGLRAAGFSARQILWPFFGAAVVLTLTLYRVNHVTAPSGWNEFKNRYAAAMAKVASVDPEPGTLFDLGDWKMFAKEVDREKGEMSGVHVFRYKGESMMMNVTAKRGLYVLNPGRGIQIELLDGELARSSPEDPSRIVRAFFERYRIFVPFGADVDTTREALPVEMTSEDIRARLQSAGLTDRQRWELQAEASVRTAAALSPLALFWAAWPFGLRLERHGRAYGLALSLALLFGHYGLTVFGLSLGRRGASLAAWAPFAGDAALLTFGALMAWRKR